MRSMLEVGKNVVLASMFIIFNNSCRLFFLFSFRALLPDLAEDLVRKAIDTIFPNLAGEEPSESCQSESKTQECSAGFFMMI